MNRFRTTSCEDTWRSNGREASSTAFGEIILTVSLISPDTVDDGFGAVILVSPGEALFTLGVVTDVAAFDEDGWTAGFVENCEVFALAGVAVANFQFTQ